MPVSQETATVVAAPGFTVTVAGLTLQPLPMAAAVESGAAWTV